MRLLGVPLIIAPIPVPWVVLPNPPERYVYVDGLYRPDEPEPQTPVFSDGVLDEVDPALLTFEQVRRSFEQFRLRTDIQWVRSPRRTLTWGEIDLALQGSLIGALRSIDTERARLSVEEHVEAFLDYARRDDRAGFLELANMLGIEPALHDEMWRGTVARLPRKGVPQ